MENWYIASKPKGDLESIVNSFRAEYNGLDLSVFENDTKIHIMTIKLPKEMRDQGIGTKIMACLKEYAQSVGKPITLCPQAEFRKKKKLENFYKNLDFVRNKGRNRDYRISDPFAATMYWKPKE